MYPLFSKVPIRTKTNCASITENQFKKIIEDNYYNPQHFWFELDHAQTSALIAHFVPLPSHTNTRADHLALPASTTTFSKATSSSRCTYAEACVPKKDFDMPVNLVDKNNFPSLSCGDEDSNHGVSSKTSCGAIEDMENVETVSDWEEWAVENMQVMNVDASTCMDPEHKLQEHEVGNEASEPQVETVFFKLRSSVPPQLSLPMIAETILSLVKWKSMLNRFWGGTLLLPRRKMMRPSPSHFMKIMR